ncbi:bile acid:sodium symporter [Devosia yakushimensis]|uniref:Bile acid:sodium symporter n=1 Tax=Devosia yakushimensis TaxID=470028 RepID=A0ABQ5U9I6_9HYPH|nr:bile acid:sodium symporter family protein [Devosia yakushimensis]GLQ08779.1 bile acid:sodium symporter [Devosia yakushimensis]
MSLNSRLKRIGFDSYLLMLLGTVILASLLPARGMGAVLLSQVAYFAVALLFFLYGAKLNTGAIVAGLANWRLQALVFGSTFIAFPIAGLVLSSALSPWLRPEIVIGILYLAVLPSTVQSSIAFTSIAHGNVPAAVCAASISNLLGVFITPLFAALLLHTSGEGGIDLGSMLDIGVQILLPFALGQLMRPLVGKFIQRHAKLTQIVDRGSILLIVYSAFSAGMVAGIWQQVDVSTLAIMIGADALLLAVIMIGTSLVGRLSGLVREDRLVLLFCGSKKSLASGLPMANILFAGQTVSLIVLPLMIFHQIQLFVCAVIAQRAGHRASEETAAIGAGKAVIT